MTTPTEQQLQEGMQTAVIALDNFGYNNVGISKWQLRDQSFANQPFFIIDNADDMPTNAAPNRNEGVITIPCLLGVHFRDYETSGVAFRDNRQIIIDGFETGVNRTLGLAGVMLNKIVPLSPIDYPLIDPNNPMSMPGWVVQLLGFEWRIF